MPLNAVSGSSCTIHLLQPPTVPASGAGSTTQPCAEYKHETTVDPTTGAVQETVTIESQQCPFEIALDVKPTAYSRIRSATHSQPPIASDCVCEIYLDGIYIVSHVQPKTIGAAQLPVHIATIVSPDYSVIRSLQFATVNLVDPDQLPPAERICEDQNVIKSLGTIRVDVFKCNSAYLQRMNWNGVPAVSTSNQMKFSEKSKKACLATTAGLSAQSVSGLSPPSMQWYPQAAEATPFLQFIFDYKPRVILEAEGTIPQAAAPKVIVDSAKNENNPKAQSKNNKRLKTEDGDDKMRGKTEGGDDNKRVKTEDDDETVPQKTSKIIDLTGSDDM
ncbi:hypothetical protein PtA15_1A119 [Puccinia triticina]|uniref:DUF7918 domain-containing protein n=1 Tax=Puccinia triticina TaxID=208348 RepID=A0ABY7C6J4_9BASI|nr:uncharacterized protein PtA15_1A119 [Puccinia triticina]WAQ80781.1 hypothetical protein PtA15_1A119 [Puccinia triticina]